MMPESIEVLAAIEAGEIRIDYDLYLRITDLRGWPR